MAIDDYPPYPQSLGPYSQGHDWCDTKKSEPQEMPRIATEWPPRFTRVDMPHYDGITDFYVAGLAMCGLDVVRFQQDGNKSAGFTYLFPVYDAATGAIVSSTFFIRLAPLKLQKATYP